MTTDILNAVINHLLSVVRNEFARRDEAFGYILGATARAASAKHMLNSGNCITDQLANLDREVDERAALLLNELERARKAFKFGVTNGSAEAARQILIPELSNSYRQLKAITFGGAPFNSLGDQGLHSKVAHMADKRFEKIRTHVSLRLTEWEARAMNDREDWPSGANVTIHGNGNVVQAGIYDGSSASIVVGADNTALLEALDALCTAVEADSSLDQATKAEVLDIARGCRREAAKPEPNKIKLAALAQALKETATAVESIKTLWGAVVTTLAAFGIFF